MQIKLDKAHLFSLVKKKSSLKTQLLLQYVRVHKTKNYKKLNLLKTVRLEILILNNSKQINQILASI